MRKKKNSVALFEVIAKSRAKDANKAANLPDWAGPAEPGEGQGLDSPVTGEETVPSGYSGTVASPELTVTVSYPKALVIALVALLVVILAFWLGQAITPAPQAASPAIASYTGQLTSGKYHVRVDEIATTGSAGTDSQIRDSMKAVCNYFWAHGEPVSLRIKRNRTKPATRSIWSARAFDNADSPEAKKHLERMKELLMQVHTSEDNSFSYVVRDDREINPEFKMR